MLWFDATVLAVRRIQWRSPVILSRAARGFCHVPVLASCKPAHAVRCYKATYFLDGSARMAGWAGFVV